MMREGEDLPGTTLLTRRIDGSGNGKGWQHRATCTHMRSRPPFIGPTYIKVCSDSPSGLDLWALQSPRGAAAPRCKARGTNCWQR